MAILKRLAAPRWWKIPRKLGKFVVSPRPGPHPKEECIPLAVLIRDYLKLAENLKEAKRIIKRGFVRVNGKVRKDHKFPVGLMDVVELGEKGKEGYLAFRIVPSKGGFELKPIKDPEHRLIRIDNKRFVRGGKVQLNFHNGENMLVDPEEAKNFSTGDVFLIETYGKHVLKHLKLEPGAKAFLIKGENRGRIGEIKKIEKTRSMLGTLVGVKLEEKEIRVPKSFVFVVGKEKPEVEV